MKSWLVSLRRPDDPGDLAETLDVAIFYAPEEKALRAEVDARRARRQLAGRAHRGDPAASPGARCAAHVRGDLARPAFARAGHPPRARALRRRGSAHGLVAAPAVRDQLQFHRPRE
ncbi:MAG: hypothetical protein WDN28_00605 [Chthoniobacter sp.]